MIGNIQKHWEATKFDQQRGDERQSVHTQKELVAGIFGARMGFMPEYEPQMIGKTPDWRFLDPNGKPFFFADVLNFHIDERIEREMEKDCRTKLGWCGDLPASEVRLRHSLEEKAGKYSEIADKLQLPFVVFVYGWFDSFLHWIEIQLCLQKHEYALCKNYLQLSGVYHFDDAMVRGGEYMDHGYQFRFFANPYALRPLKLGDGFVPVPVPDPEENNGHDILVLAPT